MSLSIDLNCDMGESFGPWVMGHDEQVIPWVTSVNIACGFHAGDPGTMRQTVALALSHGVKLGAHPGLPDLAGFGRRVMAVTPEQVYDMVVVQVGALAAVARTQGAALHHVKAHGALYNMAARDAALAKAIAQAVADMDRSLILYALAGSVQVQAGRDAGLTVAQEVFADRSYQDDGSLTARQQAGAMITDAEQSVQQVMQMIEQGTVTSLSGKTVPLSADTLCLHGDQAGAAEFAQRLHHAFKQSGVRVQAV
ncbi:LamB/YcsF family protein [Alcaligenes faecalis]|uniref:LamB/YcsF family protein n=1 Tax=Alcaligenes faecalis TaxID=511 RepID=UPI000F0B86A8|nr:5-oxoprolinase subunit PxpA [Alcaligenes faecalis]AYR19760.1 5-oxoprolinase subunit PxpA [Alcaligenes faecalis]